MNCDSLRIDEKRSKTRENKAIRQNIVETENKKKNEKNSNWFQWTTCGWTVFWFAWSALVMIRSVYFKSCAFGLLQNLFKSTAHLVFKYNWVYIQAFTLIMWTQGICDEFKKRLQVDLTLFLYLSKLSDEICRFYCCHLLVGIQKRDWNQLKQNSLQTQTSIGVFFIVRIATLSFRTWNSQRLLCNCDLSFEMNTFTWTASFWVSTRLSQHNSK